jgi:signal transduction histidine kinase/ActR/RegA family two-component response regulator
MRFNVKQLNQLFPFHLVIAESGRIVRYGNRLARLLPEENLSGKPILEAFKLIEPRRVDRWDEEKLTGRAVVLQKNGHSLSLKGEVIFLPDQKVSLFAAAPWITAAGDLKRLGLQFHDFPVHQGVTDFLFMLNAQENHAKDAQLFARRLRDQYETLNQRQKLLDSLITNMPEGGALVIRQDGRVFLAGGMDLPCRSLVQLDDEGVTLSELFGKRGAEIWSKIEGAEKGDPGRRFLYEDGKNVYRCTVNFLTDHEPSKSRWLVIFQNISEDLEHQQHEERLQRLDSVGILAGGIAHDFNNYLTSILGNITLAQDAPDVLAESLTNAEEACKNAQQLTRQLLTFAKGGEPIQQTADLVETVGKAAKFSLSGSKVKLEFVSRISKALTQFDPGQISQVINNLCINAVQAMNGRGKIKIRMAGCRLARPLESLDPGRYVKIDIEDDGPGIPPDILPRIWDAYFTTKASGSGLGLASCLSIIERHHGRIKVTSSRKKGARFSIHLPFPPPAATKDAPSGPAEETPLAPSRVLVMDDQAPIRMVSRRMFEKLGQQVVTVANGPDAVAVYRDAMRNGVPFQLVVLDMTIPGSISGQETLELLREIDPSAYAVICSGYSEQPLRIASGEREQFDSFLPKPFTLAQVRQLLHNHRQRGSMAA